MASPFETGIVKSFDFTTGDRRIDPFLVLEYKWGNGGGEGTPATVTYSFPSAGAHWDLSAYGRPYAENEPLTFTPFDANQQTAARAALTLWSEVANISFVEIDESANLDNVGDIRFGNSGAVTNSSSAAWAWTPYDGPPYANYPENGDVWFDYEYDLNLELQPGEFGFSTMIHEIGHAIGLDHPFADEVGEIALPAGQANQRYSIMAYNLYSGATIEAYGPMLYDILALQYMYGKNTTTHAGDDVYTFQTDKEYLECIWDAGGHDTIDLSIQTRNQVIDLREGHFSSIGTKNTATRVAAVGNVAIAFDVDIEDAKGGFGHDKITGNGVANSLIGNIGNDTIVGGAGNDTLDGSVGVDSMNGEGGDDLYRVNVTTDKVIELLTQAKGGGVDRVESEATYSLAALVNVENLTLFGSALNATGNALVNTLIGNAGNNVLDGKGGADILKGGAGNDTYIVDNVGDGVDEQGNADANDTVKSSALIAGGITGIENYLYTGAKAWTFTADAGNNLISSGSAADTLKGGDGNDSIVGGGGNDSLFGEGGNDTLDGGLGNDNLAGGAGNDLYVINVVGDSITEEGLDADDQIKSTVSVNLAVLAGGLVEHATLLGTGAVHAFGNDSINHLTGNTGANKLDGGIGADVLTGGKGSDTYVVNEAGDQIFEDVAGATGGIDTVQSSIDFSLAALVNVEKLTLIAGFVGLDGTGNGLNNTLTGNEFANKLDGSIGRDTMAGGAGDDYYLVDNIADVVTETILNGKGGGIDTVESSVTYSLAARANVDHLILTGSNAINGTGNALNNEVTGNTGNNVLIGGTGNDTVTGGDGNDKLDGAAGNDVLDGGNANDTLIGGAGNDLLHGGEGIDQLTGGTGRDIFDYDLLSDAGDAITGFVKGAAGDILDLSDLLDSFGDPADPFADGFLAFLHSGANTAVQVDADGSMNNATTLVTLLNVHLNQSDTANYIVETV